MTLVWLLMRWRPSFKRMLCRNPEKAVEFAQQLINEERYGTRDGLPPPDPFGSTPSAHASLRFGNPH
jgi:hypothetical protein